MKRLLRIAIWITIVLILLAAFVFGQDIVVTAQLKLFEELKAMAIALLTIVGIWLGVLYPNELQKVMQKGSSLDGVISNNIQRLVMVMIISGVSLLLLFGASLLANILKDATVLKAHLNLALLRGISFVAVVSIALAEIYALFLLLGQNLGFVIQLRLKELFQNKRLRRFFRR